MVAVSCQVVVILREIFHKIFNEGEFRDMFRILSNIYDVKNQPSKFKLRWL